MSRLIVWGAGTLGGRVAADWVAAGGEALGFTAGRRRHLQLQAAGVTPHIGSIEHVLRPSDTLLLALPGADRQTMAVSALKALPPPARVVMIGSTAYYGARRGEIKEDHPHGAGDRAARAAGAEVVLRSWAPDAIVLRMGGLYQLGRGPLSALKKRGAAPSGDGDAPLPLLHYDDAVTATLAALRCPAPALAYTCVAPPCPTRQEFYLAACVLLALPWPEFSSSQRPAPVDYNISRMRADLLFAPAHPRWQTALVPGEG